MDWFLLHALIYLISLLIVVWVAGAVFYDVGRGSIVGALLAIGWLALVTAGFLYWEPTWKPFTALLLFFGAFLGWWFSQRPLQVRNWDPNFQMLATVRLDGDVLTIENVRNTEYRSIADNTPRYETRTFRLSHMQGVDGLILYWGSPWMSHPMFVFDFGADGRVCISIEVRYRVGQQYGFVRSLYRQQELIYVVSDERDAILRRTKYMTGHDLYLFRLYADPLIMRQFFLEYTNSINRLAEKPRWYNGVTTNCTTGIYGQGRGRMQWDWRMLFNGRLDQMMYDRKVLAQSLPFAELKAQSRVNDVANRAPAEGFGDYIRRELSGYHQ